MTESATDTVIGWTQDDNGVVTLCFDDPHQSVNTMNGRYLASMADRIARLRDLGEGLTGVVLTSAKKTFFAGGDLHDLIHATPAQAGEVTEFAARAKAQLRALETLGVPVVAALSGAALGGGYEIALAAQHRIALDRKHVRIGLPEVTLGLLPGGGGVVRSVRLLGLEPALSRVLLPGTAHSVQAALEFGLIDEVVEDETALREAALAWIAGHPGAVQPWDRPGFEIPGGDANDPAQAAQLPTLTASVRAQHRGNLPSAVRNILCAAVESTQVDIDSALAIETRYFVELACGQVSTNMIQGTFFDLQAVRAGASRPGGYPPHTVRSVAVLGAGMMGAGIALASALAGLDVRLKDVDLTAARKGRAYSEKYLAKQVARGAISDVAAAATLQRITPVAEVEQLRGVDVVIEAVFEDPDLKAAVFAEVTPVVGDALLATNTSTLPISDLAKSVPRRDGFVGLHFFSPVERMDLLEIVAGDDTSDATLAKAFDIARTLGKTPIVVNDGRGFFTSRVILQRLIEAAAMIGEGIAPQSIERASLKAGYPVGTLSLLDELTLTLPRKIRGQFRAGAERNGERWIEHGGDAVLDTMIDRLGRPGRAAGAGFYDYVDGRRTDLWPALTDEFGPWQHPDELDDLVDRLLFAEAIETVRCFDTGILRSTADANVGSLLGIGFPTWTGGTSQFVSGYPGGGEAFAARARELADQYGPRFEPPASVLERTHVPLGA
jgi:3-hydroxyacyl-CoA dehydrogenase/enoyl-CoA hydratase/3-hydroxybutyryl-CoA epimerase